MCEKHYRRWRRTGTTDVTVVHGLPNDVRFWTHVVKGPDCWLWTSETVRGYGRFKLSDRSRVMAHRYAYELAVGPIPDGLTIDHLCRTPLCVRPDHLEPVTMRENILRARR